jgi:mono/diheme cytochrome c family protein
MASLKTRKEGVKTIVTGRTGGPKVRLLSAAVLLFFATDFTPQVKDTPAAPTFYRDVLPLLQDHCQVCHRSGGVAPMAFQNYQETQRYASAIRAATLNHTMPPWFAEKGVGKFSNDPSLADSQIAMLAAWANANAPLEIRLMLRRRASGPTVGRFRA